MIWPSRSWFGAARQAMNHPLDYRHGGAGDLHSMVHGGSLGTSGRQEVFRVYMGLLVTMSRGVQKGY